LKSTVGIAIVKPATNIGIKKLKSLIIAIIASGAYPTIEDDLTAKLKVIARVRSDKFLSKILGLILR
jgi:hypothetical protein